MHGPCGFLYTFCTVTSGGPGPCRSYPSLTWTSSLEVPFWKAFFWNPKGWQIGESSKVLEKVISKPNCTSPKRVGSKPSAKLTKARPNTVHRKQTIMSSSHSHLPMFFDGSKFWAVHQSQVILWICWYNQDTRTIYYLKVWVMTQGRYCMILYDTLCIFCAYRQICISLGVQRYQQIASLLWSFWTIWGCFRSPWMISTTRRIFPETSSFCPSQGQPSHPPAKSPR